MQAAEKTYNGWKNYETWAVALHFDNDRGTHEMIREQAAELVADAPHSPNVQSGVWTAEESARFLLADRLKDLAETLCGIGDESADFGMAEPTLLATDMIRAALSEVDWDEIARNILSES